MADTSQHLPEVTAAEHEAMKILAQAKSREVDSEVVAEQMTKLIEYCDARVKALESARVALVKPLNNQVKFINSQFKGAKESYQAASREGRERLKPWLRKLDEQRRQAEEEERRRAAEAAEAAMQREREREKAERDAAEAARDAKLAGEAPPPPPPPPEPEPEDLPPPPPPAPRHEAPRGEKKTARTQKRWTWEVEDLSKVPREFLQLDRGKVTAAVRNGERDIEGIRIFEDETVVMR